MPRACFSTKILGENASLAKNTWHPETAQPRQGLDAKMTQNGYYNIVKGQAMCKTLEGLEKLARSMDMYHMLPSLAATATDLESVGSRSSSTTGGVRRRRPTFASIGAQECEHALTFVTRRLPSMWTTDHSDSPILCLHLLLSWPTQPP